MKITAYNQHDVGSFSESLGLVRSYHRTRRDRANVVMQSSEVRRQPNEVEGPHCDIGLPRSRHCISTTDRELRAPAAFDPLRGAGVVALALAQLEQRRECVRYDRQELPRSFRAIPDASA